jgi:hypothetical protein
MQQSRSRREGGNRDRGGFNGGLPEAGNTGGQNN